MVVRRTLEPVLLARARTAPIIAVTGPRQSGKTTLCRAAFPDHAYVSLEPLDTRESAREDPRGFLRTYRGPVIIDEVQHVPDLLSYLQTDVDEDPTPGRFVLTGSQHFGLLEAVSQSLAGRVSVVNLLPMSFDELQRFEQPPRDLWTTMWTGGYPRIYDRGLSAREWLADYVTTYVQRDVRQVLNVGDLLAFTQFVRLCAGRTATEVNLSSLGADAGVSHNTARSWLSILETAFLCIRIPAWRTNLRKQEIKAPKLHFVDTGLVCSLLGITEADQLLAHPLRGAIFESWVASEIFKGRLHRGDPARLAHYRDAKGLKVDLVCETSAGLIAIEAKSGATVPSDAVRPLERFLPDDERMQRLVVYGGDDAASRGKVRVRSWRTLGSLDWA